MLADIPREETSIRTEELEVHEFRELLLHFPIKQNGEFILLFPAGRIEVVRRHMIHILQFLIIILLLEPVYLVRRSRYDGTLAVGSRTTSRENRRLHAVYFLL